MPARRAAVAIAVASWGAVLAPAGDVWAAEAESARAMVEHQDLPRARIDVGYALSFRNDSQAVQQVDVSAKGLAPSHLRFDGAVWFGSLPLGLAAKVNWERFSLVGSNFAGDSVSFAVDCVSAAGGLATRIDLKGWALEGALGYQYQSLPIIDAATAALDKGALGTHGPMIALRFGLPAGSWILPDVHASAVPYAMANTPHGSSTGWMVDAGAGIGFGGLSLAGLDWSAVLGYDFSTTQVDGDGGHYIQRAHRASLGLRLSVPGDKRMVAPPVPTGPGRILGRLLDPDGKPVAAHLVEVVGREPVTTRDDGTFTVKKAGPGAVAMRAVEAGLKPAERTVDVPPEVDVTVELQLARPTGPGSIRGVVFDKPTDPAKRVPVAGVKVEAAGKAVESGADGAFVLAEVGPGLVPLKLSAKGFVAADEVVQVPPEAEAKVELSLIREKAKPLATLRGLVRGPGGKPLAARLTVPEAKISATTGANGEFKVQVPGGRYKVQIEADGFIPQTKLVQVADGDQAIFNIDLHPSK